MNHLKNLYAWSNVFREDTCFEIEKGVVLKKQQPISSSLPEEKTENKFSKPAEINNDNINKSLLSAIQMRGFQLNKNNVNDDESEGSDSWSD